MQSCVLFLGDTQQVTGGNFSRICVGSYNNSGIIKGTNVILLAS